MTSTDLSDLDLRIKLNDTVEIDVDGKLIIADVVALHNGQYQENFPPYCYKTEKDRRLKVRNHSGAYWSTLSKVERIIMKAKDSLHIASQVEGLIQLD